MSKSISSSHIWVGQEKHIIAIYVVQGSGIRHRFTKSFLLATLMVHRIVHSSLEEKPDLSYSLIQRKDFFYFGIMSKCL